MCSVGVHASVPSPSLQTRTVRRVGSAASGTFIAGGDSRTQVPQQRFGEPLARQYGGNAGRVGGHHLGGDPSRGAFGRNVLGGREVGVPGCARLVRAKFVRTRDHDLRPGAEAGGLPGEVAQEGRSGWNGRWAPHASSTTSGRERRWHTSAMAHRSAAELYGVGLVTRAPQASGCWSKALSYASADGGWAR